MTFLLFSNLDISCPIKESSIDPSLIYTKTVYKLGFKHTLTLSNSLDKLFISIKFSIKLLLLRAKVVAEVVFLAMLET